MIHVNLERAEGRVTRVTVSGHAMCAPKGEDLVCAAVSALAQTFYFSLVRVLELKVRADVREGYLSIELPEGLSASQARDVELLAKSLTAGLQEIDRSYPGILKFSGNQEVKTS